MCRVSFAPLIGKHTVHWRSSSVYSRSCLAKYIGQLRSLRYHFKRMNDSNTSTEGADKTGLSDDTTKDDTGFTSEIDDLSRVAVITKQGLEEWITAETGGVPPNQPTEGGAIERTCILLPSTTIAKKVYGNWTKRETDSAMREINVPWRGHLRFVHLHKLPSQDEQYAERVSCSFTGGKTKIVASFTDDKKLILTLGNGNRFRSGNNTSKRMPIEMYRLQNSELKAFVEDATNGIPDFEKKWGGKIADTGAMWRDL